MGGSGQRGAESGPGARPDEVAPGWFEPYDPHSACRVAAAIMTLFAGSLFVGTAYVPVPAVFSVSVGYTVPIVLLCCAALLLRVKALAGPLLLIVSLFGVAVILALNLLTHDASAGAQIALCAPVMFAASQLRPAGGLITLVAALVCEAVFLLLLVPANQALPDIGYVTSTLITMALLLISAGRRQNRLLTRLEQQVAVDPLTGLVTRRVLDAAATSALRDATVGAGTAMLVLDVDHFKAVNDTYGHPVGDDALIHIATVLRERIRGDAVISRLGGDELAVLLPRCDLGAGLDRARDVMRAVSGRPLPLRASELPLTVSIGVGYATGNGLELRELYAAADASLYQAKRAGRGRVGPPNLIRTPRDAVPPPRQQTGA